VELSDVKLSQFKNPRWRTAAANCEKEKQFYSIRPHTDVHNGQTQTVKNYQILCRLHITHEKNKREMNPFFSIYFILFHFIADVWTR